VLPMFQLLRGNIEVTEPQSFSNEPTRPHKLLCHQSLFDETYRKAWRDDGELAQFRKETAEANAGA
jgi:hypothetical protein